MPQITLSPELKAALELRHSKVRDGNERDRIKAVLLCSEGWSSAMISQALRKHEGTIQRHLHDYIKTQKLTLENGGSQSYLSAEQTDSLIQQLCDKTYLHQHEIIDYIKKTFDVSYTIAGLNKWLHQHKFSYKQPKAVPHKFDVEKQAQFIAEYETLKSTLNEDEPLLFMDAVHPTQATKITSGWIRTGQDKTIKTTGSRTRLNIVGAIRLNHLSEAITQRYEKTVNGDSIVDFLSKVRAAYPSSGMIHLVLDGAGYHRSKAVIEEAEKQKIALHFLPPYSPNLNPIERLWKVMNKHARNSRYFATTKEFREQIDTFFTMTLPQIASSLDSIINDNFQRLSSTS